MFDIAHYILLGLLKLLMVYHLLILLKIIPYDKVWGGRLKSEVDMLKFEAVSLITTIAFIFIIAFSSGLIPSPIPRSTLDIILLVMGILFLVNTVGNLKSINKFEKLVFTPLTLIMSGLIFFILWQ